MSEGTGLLVTTSPHIRDREDIPRIMWTVSATLAPAGIMGIVVFGWHALWVMFLATASAVATEALIQRLRGKPSTVGDGSAFVTGLLVAYVLSPAVKWYVPLIGSVFAIGVAKHCFGGLGANIWNPALAGRAFVLAAWSVQMTATWWSPTFRLEPVGRMGLSDEELQQLNSPKSRTRWEGELDAVTSATPLTAVKNTINEFNAGVLPVPERERFSTLTPREVLRLSYRLNETPILNLIFGTRAGCLGETSAIAIVLGGLVLILFGYARWEIVVSYVACAVFLGWLLPFKVGGSYVWASGYPLFELLTGGLLLGAFFMATDMVTSPLTFRGRVIFGVGCGILTAVIRRYGGYPEGVCYSILIMNSAVPLIDRFTRSRVFGEKR